MNGRPSPRDDDAVIRERRQLEDRLQRQTGRMRKAARERRTLIGDTVYLGSIGFLLITPVIAGAYLGRWLDGRLQGYSIHWTLTLIFLGLVVGAVNVALFIRD
ncbi:MAG: AtpZ/AtpI family protein [Gammaproteobacteria bacterium]